MIRANHRTSVEYGSSLPETPPGLFELWQLVGRQSRWIAGGAIAGIMLAGAYCFFAKPIYQSEAIILVNKKNPQASQIAADGQTESAVEEDLLATHLVILGFGSDVIGQALRKSGMDKAESVLASLDDDQTPAEYVEEHLEVTKGGDGAGRTAHTLKVSFTHTSPGDCETILKALIESYCDFVNEMQKSPTRDALHVVTKNRDEANAKLEQLQTGYQTFRMATRLAGSGQEITNTHRDIAAKLELDLNQIRREQIDAKSRLKAILAPAASAQSDLQRLAMVDPEHLKQLELLMAAHQGDTSKERDALVRAEFDDLLQLRIERDNLMIRFNVDHPMVRQKTLAIQTVEDMLAEKERGPAFNLKPAVIVQAYICSLRMKLTQLESQERDVERLQNRELEKASELVLQEAQQEQLRGELDRQQQLVVDLDARIDDKEAALEYDGFINRFIKSAEEGEQVSPRLALMLIVGLFLGAGLGTCIGVIRDQTQSRTPVRQQVRDQSAGRLDTERRSRFEITV